MTRIAKTEMRARICAIRYVAMHVPANSRYILIGIVMDW